jgi:hypothetical protein
MGTDPRPCHYIYQGFSSREGRIRTRDLNVPNAPEAVLGGPGQPRAAGQPGAATLSERQRAAADVR